MVVLIEQVVASCRTPTMKQVFWVGKSNVMRSICRKLIWYPRISVSHGCRIGSYSHWCWGRSGDKNECAQDSLPSKLWPGCLLSLHLALFPLTSMSGLLGMMTRINGEGKFCVVQLLPPFLIEPFVLLTLEAQEALSEIFTHCRTQKYRAFHVYPKIMRRTSVPAP